MTCKDITHYITVTIKEKQTTLKNNFASYFSCLYVYLLNDEIQLSVLAQLVTAFYAVTISVLRQTVVTTTGLKVRAARGMAPSLSNAAIKG